MSKNASFKRTYTIKCKGISTNDFLPKMLDDIVHSVVLVLDGQHKQLEIELEVSNEH